MHRTGHSSVLYFLVITIILIICASSGAQAWSNGGYSDDPLNPDYGTHDWIAEKALTIQVKDVSFLTTTYHSEFLLGTEAPDNPSYIGDNWNHHVYYYSDGTLQDDASADRASAIYTIALQYIKDGDYDLAAFEIGVMSHYISDVGVFGHTMGSTTDWGTEVHHSDYENTIESMVGSLDPPTGLLLGDKTAYSATLDLARDVTFGSGAIKSNVWMDANYNWANSVFEDSAKASLRAAVAAVAAAINHLMIEATSSPPDEPAPPAPQPLVPQPPIYLTASVEGSVVVLTWAPPTNDGGAAITSYKIYRGTSPNSQSYLAEVIGNVLIWEDANVEKGTTYYYSIVAQNSVGSSNMSQFVSAIIPEDPNSLVLPIVISSILVALGSGGTVYWMKKKRGKPLS
ncbi:MAG: zinc dependent phospholipase C family protein [Thermoplasmata archaeon]|nr:zinc dependent phospholipase C family protein [Thermoplasmata archaeon]